MSTDNITFVQDLYAAFGRGDIASIVGNTMPTATWHLTGSRDDHPLLGTRRGPEGVQNFFQTLSEVQTGTEFSPREFYPSGDKVFVLGNYAWTMKRSGKPVAAEFIHIFTIKDGKLAAFHEFTDTAQFAQAYHG